MLEKAGMQAAPNEQVVNKKPKAKALENITISSDDNLTLEDKGSSDEDAEVAKYTWQINEQTKTGKKVDFGKLEVGEYEASLFVTDNEGSESDKVEFKVIVKVLVFDENQAYYEVIINKNEAEIIKITPNEVGNLIEQRVDTTNKQWYDSNRRDKYILKDGNWAKLSETRVALTQNGTVLDDGLDEFKLVSIQTPSTELKNYSIRYEEGEGHENIDVAYKSGSKIYNVMLSGKKGYSLSIGFEFPQSNFKDFVKEHCGDDKYYIRSNDLKIKLKAEDGSCDIKNSKKVR